MNQTQPERAHSNGVASLEANLDICQAEIRKALARAAAVNPAVDEHGFLVSNANGDALRYLKMSAKLGLALAKLKGEHTNNINVRKIETVEQAPPEPQRLRHVPRTPLQPDLEREARVNKIYYDWVAAQAARKARGEDDVDEEGFEDDEVDEKDREEGDPPPNFEGSNTEK